MKKIILILIVTLFASIVIGQPKSTKVSYENLSVYNIIDVNNIRFYIKDYNLDASYRTGGDANWFIENYNGYGLVYDHGMWLTGKINNNIKSGIREWWYQYSPGPIIDGQPALISHPENSDKYRIYKLTGGDDETNPDYAEWPVEFGAPVDMNGNPKLYGNQMLWTVYNLFDTNFVPTNRYYIPTSEEKLDYILPVEVRETVYAHAAITNKDDDLLSNIIFIEYEFINKGDVQIDSAYWGFWTDIDFADFMDNNPLVDPTRQLGLCYSSTDVSGTYTDGTPAVGYALLYGPQVESPSSTAVYKGKEIEGKKNLNLNTFHPIMDDSIYMPADSNNVYPGHLEVNNLMGPIYVYTQAWNVARGNGAYNIPYYDPYNEEYTNFPFSGNPETGEGWYAYQNNPGHTLGGGAGFVFFAGPFDFAPADTQWVMLALIPALGEDNFDSITKLKNKVDELRNMPYDSLAVSSRIITSIDDNAEQLPLKYELMQNYPNPFNPTTRIEYTIPNIENVKLEIFNVLGERIEILFDGLQQPGKYSVDWNASKYSSGVYILKMTSGFYINNKKMLLVK